MKILPAVWHDQRNNRNLPFSTCNATTIAMVMQYKGIIPADYDKSIQLDDYVTMKLSTREAWAVNLTTMPDPKVAQRILHLSDDDLVKWTLYQIKFDSDDVILQQSCVKPRNNPYVLKWYLEKMGLQDTFTIGVNFEEIKKSIDNDMPVIVAGNYLRKRTNGTSDTITHINGVVGYNDIGFVMNDPFGNAVNFYLPNEKGEYNGDHVVYSYELCRKAFTQQHILKVLT